VYYRLSSDLPEWAQQVLADTAQDVAEQTPYVSDRETLAAMPNRPGAACYA